jgi:hypothetical protein
LGDGDVSQWRDLFASLSGRDNEDTIDKTPSDAVGGGVLSSLSSLSTPGRREEEGVAVDASLWIGRFEERTAHRHPVYSRAVAERLAWAEIEGRWHLEQGERVPRELCAGCREPIGEAKALDLIDGCRVHLRPDHNCLIRYGGRWRAAATRALVLMGLTCRSRLPPSPRSFGAATMRSGGLRSDFLVYRTARWPRRCAALFTATGVLHGRGIGTPAIRPDGARGDCYDVLSAGGLPGPDHLRKTVLVGCQGAVDAPREKT